MTVGTRTVVQLEVDSRARDLHLRILDPPTPWTRVDRTASGTIVQRPPHRGVYRRVRVELMLTSGWCPFAARLLGEVRDRIAAQPGVDPDGVDVDAVWDEPWTPDRLSPRARSILRFLPPPSAVPDRDAYVSDHLRAGTARQKGEAS